MVLKDTNPNLRDSCVYSSVSRRHGEIPVDAYNVMIYDDDPLDTSVNLKKPLEIKLSGTHVQTENSKNA